MPGHVDGVVGRDLIIVQWETNLSNTILSSHSISCLLLETPLFL